MGRSKKKNGSFVKQAAILAMAGMLVRVIGFLYRLPLTNMIGDVGNAIYGAGYYIYTFLLILSSAGLPAAISKMVSERMALREYRNAHKVFKVSLFISGTLGFIFMIILYFFAKPIAELCDSPDSYWCIVSLSPTLFIVAIMSVYRGYFQGMNTMIPTSISQVVEQIFNAFFSVYLAWLFLGIGVPEGKKNIVLGAAGGTAGTGIGALAGLIVMLFSYFLIKPFLYKRMRMEGNRNINEKRSDIAKTLICTAIPIIAGTAVFSITNLIDMGMVTSRLQKAGYTYERARELYGQLNGKYVTLTTLPVSITTSLATAAIPSIAASARTGNKRELKRKINVSIRLGMIVSIPAAVGIGVLGEPIINMLYPKHSEGGMLLTAGAIAIIFLALCQIVTGMLQGVGKVEIPVIGAILGAIIKTILNYFLIATPSINIFGAVYATTGCYLIASFFNVIMLSRITKVRVDFVGALLKPTVGSTVMGICCFGLYKLLFKVTNINTISTLVSILISVIIYGIVMLFIKGLTEDDLYSFPMGGKLVFLCKNLGLL